MLQHGQGTPLQEMCLLWGWGGAGGLFGDTLMCQPKLCCNLRLRGLWDPWTLLGEFGEIHSPLTPNDPTPVSSQTSRELLHPQELERDFSTCTQPLIPGEVVGVCNGDEVAGDICGWVSPSHPHSPSSSGMSLCSPFPVPWLQFGAVNLNPVQPC